MQTVREQLTARQIAKIGLDDLNLEQKKLVKRYQAGDIDIRMHNDLLMQIIELKRVNEAIYYNNKELADNKTVQ